MALASFCGHTASAQRTLTATEVGAGVITIAARQTFAGGELGLALRPGAQTRVAAAVAGGTSEGQASGRAQLTAQFLVTPAARRGIGLYGGLGAVFSARRRSDGVTYLALLLGVEAAPGRSNGWYVEVGLGGGVRGAAGWRMRWFPRWWTGNR